MRNDDMGWRKVSFIKIKTEAQQKDNNWKEEELKDSQTKRGWKAQKETRIMAKKITMAF